MKSKGRSKRKKHSTLIIINSGTDFYFICFSAVKIHANSLLDSNARAAFNTVYFFFVAVHIQPQVSIKNQCINKNMFVFNSLFFVVFGAFNMLYLTIVFFNFSDFSFFFLHLYILCLFLLTNLLLNKFHFLNANHKVFFYGRIEWKWGIS